VPVAVSNFALTLSQPDHAVLIDLEPDDRGDFRDRSIRPRPPDRHRIRQRAAAARRCGPSDPPAAAAHEQAPDARAHALLRGRDTGRVGQKKSPRLALRRETVALLAIKQLKDVVGGDSGGAISCIKTQCDTT
jgi:hypothetical protein